MLFKCMAHVYDISGKLPLTVVNRRSMDIVPRIVPEEYVRIRHSGLGMKLQSRIANSIPDLHRYLDWVAGYTYAADYVSACTALSCPAHARGAQISILSIHRRLLRLVRRTILWIVVGARHLRAVWNK